MGNQIAQSRAFTACDLRKLRVRPGSLGTVSIRRPVLPAPPNAVDAGGVCTSEIALSAKSVELLNPRPDYKLVLSITEEVVTFGDIVAHTVSVSSLEHVLSTFATLCAKELPPLLRCAVDRWETEVHGKAPIPIISDYDAVCSDCSKLFELRHLVCHEVPQLGAGNTLFANIGQQLSSLTSFIHALEEVLTHEIFGKVPLTQTDMNLAAIKEYNEASAELDAVLAGLRKKYRSDERRLKLLKAAQRAWERYRLLQSTFRHDPVSGGTIGPMQRAFEGKEITEERTKRLREFLSAEEGWL